MSKHTPGPWVWEIKGTEHRVMARGKPLVIAGRTHRAQANRAVLAAAPDLLAALEALLPDLSRWATAEAQNNSATTWGPKSTDAFGKWKSAVNALAKAVG